MAASDYDESHMLQLGEGIRSCCLYRIPACWEIPAVNFAITVTPLSESPHNHSFQPLIYWWDVVVCAMVESNISIFMLSSDVSRLSQSGMVPGGVCEQDCAIVADILSVQSTTISLRVHIVNNFQHV